MCLLAHDRNETSAFIDSFFRQEFLKSRVPETVTYVYTVTAGDEQVQIRMRGWERKKEGREEGREEKWNEGGKEIEKTGKADQGSLLHTIMQYAIYIFDVCKKQRYFQTFSLCYAMNFADCSE